MSKRKPVRVVAPARPVYPLSAGDFYGVRTSRAGGHLVISEPEKVPRKRATTKKATVTQSTATQAPAGEGEVVDEGYMRWLMDQAPSEDFGHAMH